MSSCNSSNDGTTTDKISLSTQRLLPAKTIDMGTPRCVMRHHWLHEDSETGLASGYTSPLPQLQKSKVNGTVVMINGGQSTVDLRQMSPCKYAE